MKFENVTLKLLVCVVIFIFGWLTGISMCEKSIINAVMNKESIEIGNYIISFEEIIRSPVYTVKKNYY